MEIKPEIKRNYLAAFIYIVVLFAILGSLYYSNFGDPVANLRSGELFNRLNALLACELCWYTRILMFPIFPIAIIGVLIKDWEFPKYILGLSIPGIVLSLYQYGIQKIDLPEITQCTTVSCGEIQVEYFGFATIPFMSLIAFILLTIAAFLILRINKQIEKK